MMQRINITPEEQGLTDDENLNEYSDDPLEARRAYEQDRNTNERTLNRKGTTVLGE